MFGKVYDMSGMKMKMYSGDSGSDKPQNPLAIEWGQESLNVVRGLVTELYALVGGTEQDLAEAVHKHERMKAVYGTEVNEMVHAEHSLH